MDGQPRFDGQTSTGGRTNPPWHIFVECADGRDVGFAWATNDRFASVMRDFPLWRERYRARLCLSEPHNGLLQ